MDLLLYAKTKGKSGHRFDPSPPPPHPSTHFPITQLANIDNKKLSFGLEIILRSLDMVLRTDHVKKTTFTVKMTNLARDLIIIC